MESGPRKRNPNLLNNVQNIEFARLYRREECLWNASLVSYRDKIERQNAYKRIADELAIENFGPADVVFTARSLRNNYYLELTKMGSYRKAGEVYTPSNTFPIFQSFLDPRSPAAAEAALDADVAAAAATLLAEEVDEDTLQTVVVKMEHSDEESGSECEQPPPPVQVQPVALPPAPYKRHIPQGPPQLPAKMQRLHESRSQIADSLKYINQQVRLLRPHADMYDAFGRYVASLLRTLPFRKGLLLQPQIVNLISVSAAHNVVDRPLP